MTYPADLIIPVDVRLSASGLANANFATAMLFAKVGEAVDVPEGSYRVYGSLQDLAIDYPESTETYTAASAWLGGIPRMRELFVYNRKPSDTVTQSLLDARDQTWWYWTFFTKDVYENNDDVEVADLWCEASASFFANSTTDLDVLDNQKHDDIVSRLQATGSRHSLTSFHTGDAVTNRYDTNPYSAIYLCKHFAAVNYNGTNTTITGEFKKSPSLASMRLRRSDTATLETKNAAFYTTVSLQGSEDVGRWINTKTHSTYGEFMDDVVNLDAFINSLTVALYNALANVPTKLKQTKEGQAILLARARQVCQQYITNGYLGARNFTNPDTGEEGQYTTGFEILTRAEDIEDLTPEERNERLCAPIRIWLFRAGAIHKVPVDLTVY